MAYCRLLLYHYTGMYNASQTGMPLARPLFLTWPDDLQTHAADTQFMLGDAWLVTPALEQVSLEL